MLRSSSPFSRSHLVQIPEVIEAGGVLRDMLGSLRNLDQLVRSMRVGPKGLERAIPDVHSACQPSMQAVRELNRLLVEALPHEQEAIEAVSAFVLGCMERVTASLQAASGHSMTAKNRLALEQMLREMLPQLEAGRDLLELLAEAAWTPAVASPVLEMLSIRQVSEGTASLPTVEVRIDGHLARFEVELPPSLMQGCFSILAAAYVARHGTGPILQLLPQGDDLYLELNSSQVPGTVLTWYRQPLIEPSLQVAAAALQARGCQVLLGDNPRVLLSKDILHPIATDP